MDNDVVLEQHLSPASPLLAGFRLDLFSAIKPRVTHSPLSDVHSTIFSSILDERYINPAVLYIQVSVLQVFTETLSYCFCFISLPWLYPRRFSFHQLLFFYTILYMMNFYIIKTASSHKVLLLCIWFF